jgi:hypothetical protein
VSIDKINGNQAFFLLAALLWLGTPLIDTLATFVWRVTKQRVMNDEDDNRENFMYVQRMRGLRIQIKLNFTTNSMYFYI